ncbi:hypothetical protein EV421DRAFT_2041207 [Armillaria borealis]|uniref:Uncharacterized protein n=1 Tax=Armillaria borealis TaxID=47425 RepID=A0AA39IXK1_9AGAR|nr:hypothetical protein EV421DRAFT_2041207 [Armillaria borealis]
MISTPQMNLALRRAFTSRYQKRETQAKASPKGETAQSQVYIVTGKTTAGMINRLTKRTRNPPLACAPVSLNGIFNRPPFEVLKRLRYSDGIVMIYLILYIHVTLLSNVMTIFGNVRITFRDPHQFGFDSRLLELPDLATLFSFHMLCEIPTKYGHFPHLEVAEARPFPQRTTMLLTSDRFLVDLASSASTSLWRFSGHIRLKAPLHLGFERFRPK